MVTYLNDIYIFANNGVATITLSEIIASTNITCNTGDFTFIEKKDCDNLRFGKIYYLKNNTTTIKYIAESNTLNEEDCFNYVLSCGRQKYCGKIYVILSSNKICINACDSNIGFRGISMCQIEHSADFEINCTINSVNLNGTSLSAATWEIYNFNTMLYELIETGQTMSISPYSIDSKYLNTINHNYIRIRYSGVSEFGNVLSIAKDINITNCTMCLQDDTTSTIIVDDCDCIVLENSSIINDGIISGPIWYLNDSFGAVQISNESTAIIQCEPQNKIQTSLSGYIVDDRFYITILTNDEIDGEILDEKTYFKIRYDDEYIEFTGDTICQSCTGYCNYFTVDCYYNDLTKNIILTFVGYGHPDNYFTIETGDTYNFTTIKEDSNILKLRGDALNTKDDIFNIVYNVEDPLCPDCTSCNNFNVIKEISFNTEEDCITLCENLIITDLTTNICETNLTGLIYIKREVETNCGLLFNEKKLSYNVEIDWCNPQTLCNCDGDDLTDELLSSVRGNYCLGSLEPPRCYAPHIERKPIQNTFKQKPSCGDGVGNNKTVILEYELENCGKINLTQNIGNFFNLVPCNNFPCILTGDTYDCVPPIITPPVEPCNDIEYIECVNTYIDGIKAVLVLEWSGTSEYECYEIRYAPQNTLFNNPIPYEYITNINETTYSINNLSIGQLYSIWVRGICDKNNDVATDWYPSNIPPNGTIDLGQICQTSSLPFGPTGGVDDCNTLEIAESGITCTFTNNGLTIQWTDLGQEQLIDYEILLSGSTCPQYGPIIISGFELINMLDCYDTFIITPVCGTEAGVTTIKNITP